jgi:hypothetical protein
VFLALASVLVGLFVFADSKTDEKTSPPTSTTTTTASTRDRTATTSAPTTTTARAVTPLVLGEPTGIRLLLVGQARVEVVELDTGEVHRIATNSGGSFPFARAGGVVAPVGRSWKLVRPPYDQRSDDIAGDEVQLYPANDPAHVWLVPYGSQRVTATEVDLASNQRLQQIDLPVTSQVIGPAGDGLVVSLFGGVYIASADGLRRFATGQPYASVGSKVFVVGCDDVGVCTPEIVDSRTGGTVSIDAAIVRDGFYAASFSSDGSQLAILTMQYGGPGVPPNVPLVVVDTATGVTRAIDFELPMNGAGSPPSWSSDGSWLFWPASTGVLALARGSSAPVLIDVGEVDLISLAAF